MQKIEFIKAFHGPGELRSYAVAGRWVRLAERVPGLTVRDAIAWADLGFFPEEAEPLIAQGVSPEMAGAVEEAETTVDGGPEQHMRAAVLRLAERGVIIDPELADRLGLDSD